MTNPPTNFLRQHDVPTPAPTPLSDEQSQTLQQAAEAYRQLRKCAAVANFSGITTLVLGVLGIGCLAFGVDAKGLLAVAVMLTIGTVELVGRQRILRGDEGAPKLLAMNQLAFIAAITVYCLVQMFTTNVNTSLDDLTRQVGGDLDLSAIKDKMGMMQQGVYGFYAVIMLISWGSQGRLALYYWRRKATVAAFNATPEWQRQLVRNVSR